MLDVRFSMFGFLSENRTEQLSHKKSQTILFTNVLIIGKETKISPKLHSNSFSHLRTSNTEPSDGRIEHP